MGESTKNLELNNEVQALLNITPAGTATYADMTKAFNNIGVAINEVVYSASYLADGGFSSSEVTGAAPTVTLSGDFIKTDPLCVYLDSIQYQIGAARKSDIRLTRGGKTLTCPVTLTNIGIIMGESNQPVKVNLTIAFNGKPTIAAYTVNTALSALSVGVLSLTPAFSATVYNYAANTENISDVITATAVNSSASIGILLNGDTELESGDSATWNSGTNTLQISVTDGASIAQTVITVTKS